MSWANVKQGSFIGAAVLFTMALAMITTPARSASSETVSLTFGVYQSDKATVMYRKFIPVLEYLQEAMESRLGRPVDIRLRIFKGYEEANDAIVAGDVDFVRFGAASYVRAKERNARLQLLALEEREGKTFFYGVIIVPADSPVQSLADLKGKRFAFGNRNSTIGRYLSQGELAQAGIRARDLAAHDFLERHDKVFMAVAMGDYDAGAVKETTLKRYGSHGPVRILHRFPLVTKPWIARAGLNAEVGRAIRQALFELRAPDVLKELKVTGFLPVEDTAFDSLREKIRLSVTFER